MILWINGPFGGGKTTVAAILHDRFPGSLVMDPEYLGFALRPALQLAVPVDDFQEWPAWRRLVATALVELDRVGPGPVIAPQSVVIERYWDEIAGAIASAGVEMRAVTLTLEAAEHERRIAHDAVDPGAADWRRRRAGDFREALSWLATRTDVIDVTHLDPGQTADEIVSRLHLPGDAA